MSLEPENSRPLVARLVEATVEIPLRGFRHNGAAASDPRIFRNKDGGWKLRALDRVSLDIHRGDRLGISGANGSGKTTLLRVLGGLLPLASGRIEHYGSVRPLISIGAGLVPALSGRQNVALQYDLLGIRTMPLREFTENVVEFAGIGDFFGMPVSTYSPGMTTRLQFAVNTVEPSDLLLLDEWIGVADEAFYQKAQDRLQDFISRNEALVCASHNKVLLDMLANRRVTVNAGILEF
ncbi:ATP-binding cassette domain-containing protein [Pannonibacter indicus]|uniref:ABC transporter ATP-binding protein n=1 Tax=Pannonibacter indicus TaxID=466044 RepID=UPI0035B07737